MSIEAMKHALEALQHSVPKDTKQAREQFDAIQALRTAIPQPATTEPVAQWQKRHPIRTAGRWISTDEHDAKWWSEHSRGWEVRPLYTHPAPGVPVGWPTDAEIEMNIWPLLRLRGHEALTLHDCIAAIRAASPAQKGEPV